MISNKKIEKEIRINKEFEFSLIKESEIKEYFKNFNYEKYINEKKKCFENLIDGLNKFNILQEKLYLEIKNRVNEYNAYDSEQMMNNIYLSRWNDFMQSTKENCLLYYRDFYNELDESERNAYTNIFNGINFLLTKINKKQNEINEFIKTLKIIDLFADDLSRKIITFFNKKIFARLRKNNFILLDREKEEAFSKDSIIKDIEETLNILNKLKDFNVPLNDKIDYQGSILMLKGLQSYKETNEYLLLGTRAYLKMELDKKEQKILKKFEKRYKSE